jgi:hypothetical protein
MYCQVSYLHVEVEDSHDEKIHRTFKRALEFVGSAFEEYRRKVAAHLEQRSKSLSSEDDCSSSASGSGPAEETANASPGHANKACVLLKAGRCQVPYQIISISVYFNSFIERTRLSSIML